MKLESDVIGVDALSDASKKLESEIAKYILKGKYKEGSTIKIEKKESKLIFT